MDFFLSKLLPLLVYPLGLTCLLLALALGLRCHHRLRTATLLLALAIIWLGGNRFVAMLAARSLEWQFLPQTEIPQAEAIVVLGGGERPQTPPRPFHEMTEAGDRLLYAAFLYKQGKASHILLSSGAPALLGPGVRPGSEVMAEILMLMEVPAEALWLESSSRNTYENAVRSRAILDDNDVDHVILVTSALHMPRAVRVFRKQGIDVIPAPTDFYLTQADWDYYRQPSLAVQLLNLLPSTGNLDLVSKAMAEYLGTLVYRMRGWI